jgi:hypothetical protein
MIGFNKVNWRVIGFLALTLGAILLAGCGKFDAPTASQPTTESDMALWNPGPGDRIGSGEVPLVQPGYWTSHFGQSVNPFNMPQRRIHVTSMGGTIVLGPHTLIVPAGAVDHDMEITISSSSLTGIAIDCSPSPYHFNAPVTLVLSNVGTQYPASNAAPNINAYYMAPDGSLQELQSTVDPVDQTVTTQTDHFSRYILG